MKRITSFLIALIMCTSINMLSADLSAAEEKALTLTPAIQAEIDKLSPKERKIWESHTQEEKEAIIKNGLFDTALPPLPCGLTWTGVLGSAILNCVSGNCSAVVSDTFDACCPQGSAFGGCADKFLQTMTAFQQKSFPLIGSLADLVLKYGFNATVCGLNPRVPHLGLLAGGDPKGNVKNCVGKLSASANAKTWIDNCVSGPALTSSTDCAKQRYQALQLGLDWSKPTIDCGGTYAADCNKPACPAKWGTACN